MQVGDRVITKPTANFRPGELGTITQKISRCRVVEFEDGSQCSYNTKHLMMVVPEDDGSLGQNLESSGPN